jgi:tetratricopeptide (TPR) repeat protein
MANLHIIPFIQSLTEAETRIAEDHLQKSQPLFSDDPGKESKEYILFKYVISNRQHEISDQDILRHIDIRDLTHLKVHLYNKILESLIFDRYITNSLVFNEYDTAVLLLKKKLLEFKINLRSINHGKTDALKELLNTIINDAIEYEAYDTLIEALIAKKYFISIRQGQVEFDRINADIEFYSYCMNAVFYATDCYYKIIISNDLIKSLSGKELDKHIRSSIKKLESDLKKTKSQEINYYLHILLFAESERQKNFKKAIKQCNSLLELLKKSKVIYRRERIGNALLNLCQFKTLTGDYPSAASDARKAKDYYPENSFNYYISIEQEFHAYFYDKEYPKAEICVNILRAHSLEDAGEFRKSKFIYYEICILFATGKFREALLLLNESLEIEKDKSRWNVSLRILHIQLFIELNKIDEAANSLESLRKYIERTGKNEEIKERDELIVKFLREIEKNGFQYDPSNAHAKQMLEELSDKKSAVAWEHYSPELLPFHEWVRK